MNLFREITKLLNSLLRSLTLIAQIPAPTFPADTLKRINEIDAGTAVQTRIPTAIVDVLVTVHAGISRVADAFVAAASTSATARRSLAAATQLIVRILPKLRILRG